MKKLESAMTACVYIVAFLVCAIAGSGRSQAAEKYRVFFGTGSTGEQGGIFSSVLNMHTGQLTEATLAVAALRTGVMTINPAGTRLYSSGQPAGYTGHRRGSILAFTINRAAGTLTLLNSQPSQGIGPTYLQVDPQGRNILVCHYMSGESAVLPLAEDGSLKPASSVQRHTGSSAHPVRQTTAHPHAIILDPLGRYALVPDLGLDQVWIYTFDSVTGTLTPNDPPFVTVPPGSGPRHIAFHPSEKFVYVNLELTSKVIAYRYDSEHGTLTAFQTISTLPDDYTGMNTNAGICVTPGGRFLYVSNRGHGSIAQFAIDPDTGTLRSLGSEPSRGNVPRGITIDPTGNYLIETDKRSGSASVFRIDMKTGQLTFTGSRLHIPDVGNAVFLPLD